MKKIKPQALIIAAILICVAAMIKQNDFDEDLPSDTNEDAALKVHFIDVGQADAALVECEGKTMLIDGGNKDDSDLIYSYLKNHGIDYLDYVVGTHAHEDHMGGLSGALHYADAGKIFCPVDQNKASYFSDFKKTAKNKGLEIEIPETGDDFSLGGAKVEVLACNIGDDANNTSIVLKLTYDEVSFLFMGDAEFIVEDYMIKNGFDIDSTVLKVGHHGSSSSTSSYFLQKADPEYAVVSCGIANPYGHPHDEVVEKLELSGAEMLRTDILGDIIFKSDGKEISFSTEKGESERNFILNVSSKKYHNPECENANSISEKNKKRYKGTVNELYEKGYTPCSVCG
jgi:competence protein ComEC